MKFGLYGHIVAKRQQLRKSNKQKRFVWSKEWTLDQWKSVLWSAESKFEMFGSTRRVFVWSRKGERLISTFTVSTVKIRGGGVTVLGVVGPSYIFKQDNDPKQTSRLREAYLTRNTKLWQMTWAPINGLNLMGRGCSVSFICVYWGVYSQGRLEQFGVILVFLCYVFISAWLPRKLTEAKVLCWWSHLKHVSVKQKPVVLHQKSWRDHFQDHSVTSVVTKWGS